MEFELIDRLVSSGDKRRLTIGQMCDIAGVSRSGYYAWKEAAEGRAAREEQDRAESELILSVYTKRGFPKCARNICMGLWRMDPPVRMNLKKIRRLMKKFSLSCPIRRLSPYRKVMNDMRTSTIAPNALQREFIEYDPRVVLLTDITYLSLEEGGFAYLSVILDAFTKRVLAFRMSMSLAIEFVTGTIQDLIRDRGDELTDNTLIHSDQGSHYTSRPYREVLRDKGFLQSMSRRGVCLDNAPQEGFFEKLKTEAGEKLAAVHTFAEKEKVVCDYIDYYNNERYQWKLAKLAPTEFYEFCKSGVYPVPEEKPPEQPGPFRNAEVLRFGSKTLIRNPTPISEERRNPVYRLRGSVTRYFERLASRCQGRRQILDKPHISGMSALAGPSSGPVRSSGYACSGYACSGCVGSGGCLLRYLYAVRGTPAPAVSALTGALFKYCSGLRVLFP